jgi:hypothetical protein
MILVRTEGSHHLSKVIENLRRDASIGDELYAAKLGHSSFIEGAALSLARSTNAYLIHDGLECVAIGGLIEDIGEARVWGHITPSHRGRKDLLPLLKVAIDDINKYEGELYAFYPAGSVGIDNLVAIAGLKPTGRTLDYNGIPHTTAWRC